MTTQEVAVPRTQPAEVPCPAMRFDADVAQRRAQLIRWIDSHYTPAPTIDNLDGTLTVHSVVCARNAWGDLYSEVVADRIPATLGAARDLLGY